MPASWSSTLDGDRALTLAGEVGDRVAVVAGDSNDDAAVVESVERARALGTFSIAVSATGVVIPSQPLVARDGSMLSKDALRSNLELHVCGPFNLARLAAAAFVDNDGTPTASAA